MQYSVSMQLNLLGTVFLIGSTTKMICSNCGHDNISLKPTYAGMVSRCHNKNNKMYKYYGAKGIKVCDRWLGEDGFNNFVNDMGAKEQGLSLDRIDTSRGYSPENCRWANHWQQQSNRSNNNKCVGVNFNKHSGKWVARARSNKKEIFSKKFSTYDEAVKYNIEMRESLGI